MANALPAPHVAVILVAAGASSRMGGKDKLWGDPCGEPLLGRSLRPLARVGGPPAAAARAGAVLAAARASGVAAVPGVAVADTIKRVDASGRVRETLDRAT